MLTEILRQLFGPPGLGQSRFETVTFDVVLNALLDATKFGGNGTGQDTAAGDDTGILRLLCDVTRRVKADHGSSSEEEGKYPIPSSGCTGTIVCQKTQVSVFYS